MPYNSDFYGSYPRYLILSLLEANLKRLLVLIEEENNEDNSKIIKNLSDFYFNLIIKLLDINLLARMKAICLPYTKEHREKLYIWQSLCTLQKMISSSQIYFYFHLKTFFNLKEFAKI